MSVLTTLTEKIFTIKTKCVMWCHNPNDVTTQMPSNFELVTCHATYRWIPVQKEKKQKRKEKWRRERKRKKEGYGMHNILPMKFKKKLPTHAQ